ncbi:hypothetical protein [Gracilibacillus sp. JCM 18860]
MMWIIVSFVTVAIATIIFSVWCGMKASQIAEMHKQDWGGA